MIPGRFCRMALHCGPRRAKRNTTTCDRIGSGLPGRQEGDRFDIPAHGDHIIQCRRTGGRRMARGGAVQDSKESTKQKLSQLKAYL